MRGFQFINNGIYHIYNRGVEKRNIFSDTKDYFRFIHDLFEFNDIEAAGRFFVPKSKFPKISEVGLPKIKPRKLLVEILVFCLMPNHFHLLLRQKVENGISQFMQKLGTGYTNFFNKKYGRVGSLFQGKFKAIDVNKQEYLEYLPNYIHFNSLDLIEPGWRYGEIKNFQKAMKFLNFYRWSSYLDCIGIKNFPSVTQRDFILNVLGGEQNYKQNTKKWLKEIALKQDIDEFRIISME